MELELNPVIPSVTPVEIRRQDMPKVSHSGAGLWQRCQQAWHYNYIQDLVPKGTPLYLKRGTLLHEMLSVVDQLMMQGVSASDSVLLWDYVLEFCETDLQGKMPLEHLGLYETALKTSKRYIYEWLPQVDANSRIVASEDAFEIEMSTPRGRKFLMNGYIDRTHLEDGRLWILDRKTSRTGRHWTDKQIDIDSQLLLYSVACRELGMKPFGVMVDSISTYPYKDYEAQPLDKVFKRLRSYRTPKELDFALKNYLRTVDRIFDFLESGEEPIRALSRDCTFCKYYDLCLYEMKGIDTGPLMRENYIQKEYPPGEQGRFQRAVDAQLQIDP